MLKRYDPQKNYTPHCPLQIQTGYVPPGMKEQWMRDSPIVNTWPPDVLIKELSPPSLQDALGVSVQHDICYELKTIMCLPLVIFPNMSFCCSCFLFLSLYIKYFVANFILQLRLLDLEELYCCIIEKHAYYSAVLDLGVICSNQVRIWILSLLGGSEYLFWW